MTPICHNVCLSLYRQQNERSMELTRASGILLHPTSLPGPYGIGRLGDDAFRFVDFLAAAGQRVWQILPLGPTGYGNSPYSAFSAFAGNPLLVCPERQVAVGDLPAEALEAADSAEGEADFDFAHRLQTRLLPLAAGRFFTGATPDRRTAFEDFCAREGSWLEDYALFRALRAHFDGKPWNRWPEDIRRRGKGALARWRQELSEAIHVQKYAQFAFFEQWSALRAYANDRGIRIFGDLPIFVAFDSADVWANSHLFHLDEEGRPTRVAGVPPDYFSKTGQRWGNPLYRWDKMAENHFAWWRSRFRLNLKLTDMVRIDHFRGFVACWSIPAEEKTAVHGFWDQGPGAAFFVEMTHELGRMPVVAEDLGIITDEVEDLRDRFAFPGMKVLQFAFDSGPSNPYLPHNLPRRCVLYTGTHDNDTTLGWWQNLDPRIRAEVCAYLGSDHPDMPADLVRLALASVADLAVFPLQDILGLDGSARMNTPGRARGNWTWRLRPGDLNEATQKALAEMSRIYGR